MPIRKPKPDRAKLDRVVAQARRDQEEREKGYREQALKMYPWICGRCAREFTHKNLHELTVHHRNHNHDDNPPDGSNWELLCLYCHDAEHSRYLNASAPRGPESDQAKAAGSFKPFAGLEALLKSKD
ncbi:YajD family HNH nuclease [Candidatus Methylocalor cossyra]|uniref:Putative HNH nuclease YajD n=1 Tax=Candidatus Methylocalor cossyra TaxID=3108543 RepID=A0ABP1C4Q5_9GAMM